jgi:SAM-dependent methyltransferase
MDTRGASSHEHEALELSAPLALELAPRLCRATGDGDNCAWLHGFWPCLRLAGLAATPDRHVVFYGSALGALGDAVPAVLISGAADQGMLACVLSALPRARVTVIDSCDTPLHLNRWYAGRAGAGIETARSSVLDYAPARPFDAVCTHSFFGQFARAERPGLLAAWRRLLRPGGKVITAHPLRPFGGDEPNRFTPQQEQTFRERIAAEAPKLGRLLRVAQAEVLRLADAYLRARYGYPVRSGEELAALFEEAGFDVESLACEAPPADAPPGSGGPGLRNPTVQYAHVIARRR